MKALKKESESIQKIVQEAMAVLKQAYEKLGEAYDKEDIMQVKDVEAGVCVVYASLAIEAAAAWLNSENGEKQKTCLMPAPKGYHESCNFNF